jgi:hypothetical protein
MIEADITSAKKNTELQKYALRSRNTIWRNVCSKNQNYSYIHTKKVTKYIEKKDGFTDWTEHRLQGIRGVSPLVTGSSPDQPNLNIYSSWTSIIAEEARKAQLRLVMIIGEPSVFMLVWFYIGVENHDI